MNFLIPLGAAAGGALQGLALTRELQEQVRLRKQQEYERTLNALANILTIKDLRPEQFSYAIEVLRPAAQRVGINLPPAPPMESQIVQDAREKLSALQEAQKFAKEQGVPLDVAYATVLGRPYLPEQMVEVPIQHEGKTYRLNIPASEAAKVLANMYMQQQALAAAAGGGRGRARPDKAPSSFGVDMLRDVQTKIQAGDLEGAQAELNMYNAMASTTGAVQFDIVKQKIGNKEKYILWARGAAPPPTQKTKVNPYEQARKQGLNLVPLGKPPLK